MSDYEEDIPEAAMAIAEALGDTVDEVVEWAVIAVRYVPSAGTLGLPTLIKLLTARHDDDNIKFEVVLTLHGMGSVAEAAAPALSQTLHASEPHVRLWAALTLAELKQGPWGAMVVQVLREGLDSAKVEDRRRAAGALTRLGWSSEKN